MRMSLQLRNATYAGTANITCVRRFDDLMGKRESILRRFCLKRRWDELPCSTVDIVGRFHRLCSSSEKQSPSILLETGKMTLL
jgi:hypothetical protein